VVPWYFWHLSFWGSVLNLLYFMHLDKAPLILGNCFLPFLYGRNILFLRREGTKGGGRKVFAAVMVLVLGGFAWSMIFGDDDKAANAAGSAEERTKALLQETAASLQTYRGSHAQLPSGDTRTILVALYKDVPQTDSSSTRLNAEGDLPDAWGRPIQVYVSGNAFMVRSAGKNGAFDDSLSERLDDIMVQGGAP
jgi:hypothetical protein